MSWKISQNTLILLQNMLMIKVYIFFLFFAREKFIVIL